MIDWTEHDADLARQDARNEARDEDQRAWRGLACQCGGGMPGTCPGPANCPMCEPLDDEDGQ